MSNLYSILSGLCAERGITAYRMCKDVGIQPSIMTDLKMGRRQSMKAETATKLADYFGVSVSYLMGREETKKASAEAEAVKKEDELSKKLNSLLELANEDTKEALIVFLEQTLKGR